MATIDKEQRARRKYVKTLYEVNQNVKIVYSVYMVYGDIIYGTPTKPEYKYSYYSTEALRDMPETEYAFINSTALFEAYKEDKPEYIEVQDDGKIVIRGEKEHLIGRKMTDEERQRMSEMIANRTKRIKEVVDGHEDQKTFDEEEVSDLIGYKKISPMFLNKPEYTMHIAISLFPLLKRFKAMKAYMKPSDKGYFDIVFSMFSKGERLVIFRRAVTLNEAD